MSPCRSSSPVVWSGFMSAKLEHSPGLCRVGNAPHPSPATESGLRRWAPGFLGGSMNDNCAEEGTWALVQRVAMALILLSPLIAGLGWTLRLWGSGPVATREILAHRLRGRARRSAVRIIVRL